MSLILATFALLAAYLGLLVFEARRGTRLFARQRAELDRVASQGAFILAHVDLSSFAREEALRLGRLGIQLTAHQALLGVRALERLLTRLVRRLRLHPEAGPSSGRPAGARTRSFVRTLSEFKGHLESTRPEMPEIR